MEDVIPGDPVKAGMRAQQGQDIIDQGKQLIALGNRILKAESQGCSDSGKAAGAAPGASKSATIEANKSPADKEKSAKAQAVKE